MIRQQDTGAFSSDKLITIFKVPMSFCINFGEQSTIALSEALGSSSNCGIFMEHLRL